MFSGIGFVTGDAVSRIAGNWQWGIRVSFCNYRLSVLTYQVIYYSKVTPVFGAICWVLLLVVLVEPVRGGAELHHPDVQQRSLKDDMVYLARKLVNIIKG